MSWDAIVGGELQFESEQAVVAWDKSPVSAPDGAALPAWLAPPRSAIGTVAQERSHQKNWSTSFEKYMHVPDRMEVEDEGSVVTVRAYLSGHYGSHFLGSLAAIVRAAAKAGARGEIAFVELSQMRGHLLATENAQLKVVPIDLTRDAGRVKALAPTVKWAAKRARMKLPPLGKPTKRTRESLLAAVDSDRGMTFPAPPHPLRSIHEAAGATYDESSDESFDTPTHRKGVDHERQLLERDWGIVDLSHRARVGLSNTAAFDFARSVAPSLSELAKEQATSVDLADGFDHALIYRTPIGSPELFASDGAEQLLHAWLKIKSKEGKWTGARKVEIGDGYSAYSPRIAFLGPKAPKAAEQALKPYRANELLRFGGTLYGLPAVVVHGETDALGKLLSSQLERLCGSAAERAVAEAKGVALQSPASLQRPNFEA